MRCFHVHVREKKSVFDHSSGSDLRLGFVQIKRNMYLIDSFFSRLYSSSLFSRWYLYIEKDSITLSVSIVLISISHTWAFFSLLPSLSSSKPNIAPFIFPLLFCFVFCSLWGQRISNLCIFSICHSAGEWQRSGKEEGKKHD